MGNAFAGEYASSHALAILSAAGSARFWVAGDDDFDLDCFCKRGLHVSKALPLVDLEVAEGVGAYFADGIRCCKADRIW